MADYLANGAKTGTSATVTIMQKEASWQMGADQAVLHTRVNGSEGSVSIPDFATGKTTYTVTVTDIGSVSVTIS